MNKENNYTSRATFLMKISLAFATVFGLGLAGFNFQNIRKRNGIRFKTLSKGDANEIIRNMPFPESKQITPEPPPQAR